MKVPCVQEVVTPFYIVSHYMKWGNYFLDTERESVRREEQQIQKKKTSKHRIGERQRETKSWSYLGLGEGKTQRERVRREEQQVQKKETNKHRIRASQRKTKRWTYLGLGEGKTPI